jgi:hypothetical protein
MTDPAPPVSKRAPQSSRLERLIRRLEVQRSCIDFAARPGHLPKGPVFMLGIGDGCAYDHLRSVFRSREIFVFDRRIEVDHECRPTAQNLFLGEIAETLTRVAPSFRSRVSLVHVNLDGAGREADGTAIAALAPLIQLVANADDAQRAGRRRRSRPPRR